MSKYRYIKSGINFILFLVEDNEEMENSTSNLTRSNYELYNIKSRCYDMSEYENEEKSMLSSIDASLSRYDNIDDFIID